MMVHDEMTAVPPTTAIPPPYPLSQAVLPVMVHDEMATVPPKTATPPPSQAVLPVMVHDEMATVPPATRTPPPPYAPPGAEFPEIEQEIIVTVPP